MLLLRAKYRDYYDLYFLAKGLSLREIFNTSKDVINGITYKLFAVSLIYIDDIEDDNINHLNPLKNISKEQIGDFFQQWLKNSL